MSDDVIFIRCDCHSPDHLLVIDQWHWDTFEPPHSELIVSYRLDGYLPWWRRLWAALRYVVTGNVHRHWWAEMIVKDEDAKRWRDFLNDYLGQSLNARH